MRLGRLASVLVALAGLVLVAASSAAAAGRCDPIVEAGNSNLAAQQAFTLQAYSDGTITPAEAAQADDYTARAAKITEDLGTCITTGKLPPGYLPALNAKQDKALDKSVRFARAVVALTKGFKGLPAHQQAAKLGKLLELSDQAAKASAAWVKAGLPRTKAEEERDWGGEGLEQAWKSLRALRDFGTKIGYKAEKFYENMSPTFKAKWNVDAEGLAGLNFKNSGPRVKAQVYDDFYGEADGPKFDPDTGKIFTYVRSSAVENQTGTTDYAGSECETCG
jgi:hypothetical protein